MKRESEGEVKRLTRTAREKGAVGRDPLAYRWAIAEFTGKKWPKTILDFGAGKTAKHAKRLRAALPGVEVSAWDVGENWVRGVHAVMLCFRYYDFVVVSNVLNVQPNLPALFTVIEEVSDACRAEGSVLVNYPVEPRKIEGLDEGMVWDLLARRFTRVTRVGGTKRAPLLLCYGPRAKWGGCCH